MNPINSIRLIGVLDSSPVYVTTERAADLTIFQLNTESSGSGTTRQYTHRCLAWGPAALALHEYLDKGCRLAIRGELTYAEYRDDQRRLRKIAEIHVTDFCFLDRGKPAPWLTA